MEIKLCKKCNKEYEINNFRLRKDKSGKSWRYSYCKECEKLEKQKYKEKHKKYNKEHYKRNKEKYKINHKKWNEENKEKIINVYRKKYNKEYYKKWRKKHPEKIKEYIKKDSEKIKNDPLRIIKRQARDAIRNGFRRKGFSKNTKTNKLLGCDYETFINYLLETFKNNYGYEWNGKEKIHIDHIIPLAIAKTEEEVIRLSNYKNLQLLKAEDNLKKGKKLNYDYNS